MSIEVTGNFSGEKELQELLRKLPMEGPKFVRRAANKALRSIVPAVKSSLPFASLKQSIGVRVRTKSEVITTAKVGVGVNKVREDVVAYGLIKKAVAGSRMVVPHAHLWIMGTKPRWTGFTTRSKVMRDGRRVKKNSDTGAQRRYTGAARPHPVLRAVFAAQSVNADNVFRESLTSMLKTEIAKAGL